MFVSLFFSFLSIFNEILLHLSVVLFFACFLYTETFHLASASVRISLFLFLSVSTSLFCLPCYCPPCLLSVSFLFFFLSCFLHFSPPALQSTYWFHFHTVGSCSLHHKPSGLPPFKLALIIVQLITTNHPWASLSALTLSLLLSVCLVLCTLWVVFFNLAFQSSSEMAGQYLRVFM